MFFWNFYEYLRIFCKNWVKIWGKSGHTCVIDCFPMDSRFIGIALLHIDGIYKIKQSKIFKNKDLDSCFRRNDISDKLDAKDKKVDCQRITLVEQILNNYPMLEELIHRILLK